MLKKISAIIPVIVTSIFSKVGDLMNDSEKARRLGVGGERCNGTQRVNNGMKSRDAGERPQRREQGSGRWQLSTGQPPAGSSDESNHKFDGSRHQ